MTYETLTNLLHYNLLSTTSHYASNILLRYWLLPTLILYLYYTITCPHFITHWVAHWRHWVWLLRSSFRDFIRSEVFWTCCEAPVVALHLFLANEKIFILYFVSFDVINQTFVILLYLCVKLKIYIILCLTPCTKT